MCRSFNKGRIASWCPDDNGIGFFAHEGQLGDARNVDEPPRARNPHGHERHHPRATTDEEGRAVRLLREGRVYRVDPDRTAALAIDLPERQALARARSGKTFLVGTGDVGGLYRVTPAAAKQATYLSRVMDADFHARWGLLRWHGTHELGMATRSGNTAKPDAPGASFAEH